MSLAHVFASLPAGNVPASYLDDNFNDCALLDGSAAFAASASLAAAATTNIGAQISPYVTITGNTGITAFDVQPANLVRILYFTGTPTITHNATSMILPAGGANIPVAAGDTAIARSLGGGNWIIDFYQRASGASVVAATAIPYAKYSYTVSSGTTGGGAMTATTWTTIPINTEDNDTGSIGSLSSNQITLIAGTYKIDAWITFGATTAATQGAGCRWRNVTDSSTTVVGGHFFSGATGNLVNTTILKGLFTIAGSKTFEFQYWASAAFNIAPAALSASENEVYRVVELMKLG